MMSGAHIGVFSLIAARNLCARFCICFPTGSSNVLRIKEHVLAIRLDAIPDYS